MRCLKLRNESTGNNKEKLLLVGLFYAFIFGSLLNCTQIVISPTNSLPYNVFFMIKSNHFSCNDIIVFSLEDHPILKNSSWIKRLKGVPGDVIEVKDDIVTVSGKTIGKVLPGLKPLASGVIPEGYVFLAGDSLDSLDSRYEIMGLVKVKDLEGRAFPLW